MAHSFESCGLKSFVEYGTEPKSLSLTGVSVNVIIICGAIAEVTLQKSYVNRENLSIEAVFKYKLDEGAAVHRFEIDGQSTEGRTNMKSPSHSVFVVEEDVFKVSS